MIVEFHHESTKGRKHETEEKKIALLPGRFSCFPPFVFSRFALGYGTIFPIELASAYCVRSSFLSGEKPMSWPLSQDYNEAIQSPADQLRRPRPQTGRGGRQRPRPARCPSPATSPTFTRSAAPTARAGPSSASPARSPACASATRKSATTCSRPSCRSPSTSATSNRASASPATGIPSSRCSGSRA